ASAGQLITPGAAPEAMASTPSAGSKDDSVMYTDLYVSTMEGDLFLFTADNQKSNAQGLKIMSHDLFRSVDSLYAYTEEGRVVVWGLNRSQQVFYTECDSSSVTDPSAWSY